MRAQESMEGYGYIVVDVLITDIEPDPKVRTFAFSLVLPDCFL
jgi:regulator of protease activity HflC (stomatin/prohibitin superfamily)